MIGAYNGAVATLDMHGIALAGIRGLRAKREGANANLVARESEKSGREVRITVLGARLARLGVLLQEYHTT